MHNLRSWFHSATLWASVGVMLLVCAGCNTQARTNPWFFAAATGSPEDLEAAAVAAKKPDGNETANINAKNTRGYRPIHEAAIAGNVDAIKFLIAHGADVNAKDNSNRTALWFTARRNKPACAMILLKAGADPNITDWTGRTALMMFARFGNVEVVRELLKRGANPNAYDSDKQNALSYAAQCRTEDAPQITAMLTAAVAKSGTTVKK